MYKQVFCRETTGTYFLSNEETEWWIEDYMDWETAVVRSRVQEAKKVIMQVQEHIRKVENARATTTNPETTFQEMLNEIGDSVSELVSSDNKEDGEDVDVGEDTDISNNSSFRLKHPGVPDGSDCPDRTSYPLTENYTPPIAQVTGRVTYLPPLLCGWYMHHQNDTCVRLFAGVAVML